MHEYTTISKFDIAEEQLFHAIELYIEGQYLISSITLTGAAEEILGKLVNSEGKDNALELHVHELCELHEKIYKEQPNPKAYYKIKNEVRNELKHKRSEELTANLEQEAVNLIRRAIKNYKILKPGRVSLFYEFDKEHIRRWRIATGEIT